MTVMIPFAAADAMLDWLALTDALAAGHDGPKAMSPMCSCTKAKTPC